MSQQIAEFYAKITADTQGLQQGLDAANKKLDGLSRSSQNTGGAIGGLTSKITSMINPTTIAISAVTGLAVYLGNATKAAAESAQVDAKLAAVLKATGYAAGLTAEDIDGMSTSLSKMSGVDDEVIKSSAAVLATFREIGSDVFPQAMQAALDMSAVMGSDLQGSIVQIGKALNDPIAGVSALRKVGVALTDQQREQIAAFMENGDIMSAQKVILDELGMEFGGAAESMNDAGDGSANLKVSLGNLAEYIGSGLLPGIREANKETANWIDNMIEANQIMQANADTYNTQVELGREIVDASWEGSKATMAHTDAMERAGAVASAKNDWLLAMAENTKKVTTATVEATMSEEQFKSEMETLGTILDGDLGKAQDSYNAKMAEYTRLLGEAKTQKEMDEINANIAAETEEYNKRATAIAFNIQQEAILNSQMTPESKIGMVTALGQAYGLYDEATASAITTTQEYITAVETGNMTEEQAIQYLRGMTFGLTEAGGAFMDLADGAEEARQPLLHVGKRAEDADEAFGGLSRANAELGESLRKEVASGAAAATSALLNIPTSIDVDINIRVHGQIPKGLVSGAGGGAVVQCFVAGTPVTLADGSSKPIEQLQPGDEVRSYNLGRGEFVSAKVTKIMQRDVERYLSIDGLLVTEEHPFWIVQRGAWIKARNITKNDVLFTVNGGVQAVQSVLEIEAPATVYNLTVAGEHNYFAAGVLVHNKSVDDFNTGGQLSDKGWAVVGDMPGGGWTPFTEAITPWGQVLDAKTSRAMKDAGLLDGANYLAFGGETYSTSGATATRSRSAPRPSRNRPGRVGSTTNRSAAEDTSIGDIIGSVDDAAESAVAGVTSQVLSSVQNGLTGALVPTQQQALQASTQNNNQLTELNNSLRELIGKTASAPDIGRAVGVENSKHS